jgi:hypothetical protein
MDVTTKREYSSPHLLLGKILLQEKIHGATQIFGPVVLFAISWHEFSSRGTEKAIENSDEKRLGLG